ncbi:hypothetical protein PYCCODRAFT_749419 [Trametes coccinea BRFM310]|uniref:Uncharacterized protein n=1 Tax=Trametes coccinea (strain BRFM310) TaxID=1353009 RepID=A0A1Y2IF77_TRAC3|nr:hypothetical protein PYCCODRAFT_749419 [Trametes coccinea BRFM310]
MDSSGEGVGDSNGAKKRTRSQTTLDQFSFVNLAHSPLKQAKSALKLNIHSLPNIPSAASSSKHSPLPSSNADCNRPEPNPASDNPDGHDAAADPHRKRPSSPGKDAALSHEHAAKRPRHNTPSIFPTTPAHPQLSNDGNGQRPPSAYRRALSVPAISSSVPLLDLNVIPPSPRRSPTKFRIASVPPEKPSELVPPDPPNLQPSTDPPSPLPPLPHQSSSRSPLSPLSPLPQTDEDTINFGSMPLPLPVFTPSTSAADPKPAPSTSDTKPTRLPVPTVVSRMKPKQSAPPKKPRAPRSVKPTGPSSIRMTRSASLRQKKVEEEAKHRSNRMFSPLPCPHTPVSSMGEYLMPLQYLLTNWM